MEQLNIIRLPLVSQRPQLVDAQHYVIYIKNRQNAI